MLSAMTHARGSETVEIQLTDGSVLRGMLSFAETTAGKTPSVVFAHGLGSTRSGEKAQALETECGRRGWNFAAFDFRGHGQSDGNLLGLSGSCLIEDLEAITRMVAMRIGGPLFLVGSSMGGWTAAWVAARNPERIVACAFVAPAFRFMEWNTLSERERQDWRRTGRIRIGSEPAVMELGSGLLQESALYPYEVLLHRFRTRSLVFHGMQDDLIPYSDSIDFAARCAAADVESRVLKDGDHRLNSHKSMIARAACEFFSAGCM